MKRPYMKAAAILGAAAFLFTSGFARAEDHAAGTAGYLKSATYYSDDWVINFWNSESRHMDQELARIAQAVPAKLVLAGGNSGSGIRSYLEMAHHTVEAGIAGIAFGRAVWSYPNPTALVHTLKMIIHQGWSVDEAMEYLGEHVDQSAV